MVEASAMAAAQGQFRPGTSGNPHGRPPMARDSVATVMSKGAGRVARKVVAAALAGDMDAARVVLEFGLAAKPPEPEPDVNLHEPVHAPAPEGLVAE